MPYVTCANCQVASYVAPSHLTRRGPCPACDQPLDERATRLVGVGQSSSTAAVRLPKASDVTKRPTL